MTLAKSHQQGPIKTHWNDGLRLIKREESSGDICCSSLEAQLQALYDTPTTLAADQYEAHLKRIRQHLNVESLTSNERQDLAAALAAENPEARRKALVNYIRNYDVARWAGSLRAIAAATQH